MFFITEIGPFGTIVLSLVALAALICFLLAGAFEAAAGPKGRIDHKTAGIQSLLEGFVFDEVMYVSGIDAKIYLSCNSLVGIAAAVTTDAFYVEPLLYVRRSFLKAPKRLSILDRHFALEQSYLAKSVSTPAVSFFEIDGVLLDAISGGAWRNFCQRAKPNPRAAWTGHCT